MLDYHHFKKNCKLIAIDLSKQQADDPRAIQQINFTADLKREAGAAIFFIFEGAKETTFDFSQGTVNIL